MPWSSDASTRAEGQSRTLSSGIDVELYNASRTLSMPRRYPVSPEQLDWAALYPAHGPDAKVRFLDVGCGFGGLSIALAALSDEPTLALEIRPKVCEFVRQRIDALRGEHPGRYQNVSCLRYNAQSYLPNVVTRGQLAKLFFCFPDPHFKAKNHRRRIVSTSLLAEYAYALAPGGLLYCVTDVRELHEWHVGGRVGPSAKRLPRRACSWPASTRVEEREV